MVLKNEVRRCTYDVGIKGFGAYAPEKVVDNAYFESFLETSDEWISKMTGIKERRWASEDQDTSDLAFEASKKAIEDAGITPADIDMIIVATATGDMPFPSVANMLQEKLGTRKVPTMDQLAACSGFMYSMITAKQYVQSGDYKNILVVGADKLSKITDLTDRSTAVLFGDGAGAVVIGEVSEGRGIISYEMGSDGNGGKYLYLNKDTGKLVMNGREVFKFAVRIMGEASTRVVDKAGLKSDDIDMFIPHQANIRIMESARERLGIEREKMSVSVNRFGNTSAASIPLSISQELENGRIKDDDTLVLVGFGGGLTWGAMVIKWGK
ncbi:3-oxoacyl-ACP synthase [Staphylococcus haemolyticus]|nr:3-oxoacyl-ACP synthase [Staphylococcus haemolyticus]